MKRVLVPFHHEARGFTKIKVQVPTLKVDGCEGMAEVAKFKVGLPGVKEDAVPALYWKSGWVKAPEASVLMAYGIEEDVSGKKETLVLVLNVPASCTQVSGDFAVGFK